jgi:hypothetical protein
MKVVFQVCLISGVIFCTLLIAYLSWQYVRLSKKKASTPFIPRLTKVSKRFLPAIQDHYKDTQYNYVAVVNTPGQLVLVWRVWSGEGYKDRCLDVLLVKDDGEIEMLGSCIQYEVYGKDFKN